MNRPLPKPETRSFDLFSAVAVAVVLALVGYFGWRYFDTPAPAEAPVAATADASPVRAILRSLT